MPCTSGLNQKNQRIVIGWKQKLLQCCVFYKFQIWLVLGNSVIKLPDACHQWGQIYCYESILSFPVLITIHNHSKFRVSHNHQISNQISTTEFYALRTMHFTFQCRNSQFFFWNSQLPFLSNLKACAPSIIVLYIQL